MLRARACVDKLHDCPQFGIVYVGQVQERVSGFIRLRDINQVAQVPGTGGGSRCIDDAGTMVPGNKDRARLGGGTDQRNQRERTQHWVIRTAGHEGVRRRYDKRFAARWPTLAWPWRTTRKVLSPHALRYLFIAALCCAVRCRLGSPLDVAPVPVARATRDPQVIHRLQYRMTMWHAGVNRAAV